MNELKTISIDGVEHDYTKFTDQQKLMVAQINDLGQQLAQAQFKMDQINVAKEGFTMMLKQSLETKLELA